MPTRRFSSVVLSLFLFSACSLVRMAPEKATLPQLMGQRLGWMDLVAQAKQARGLPVNDPRREAELLAAMTKLGAEAGVPSKAVKSFFAGQMQAAKVRQEEWMSAHPPAGQRGKPAPDLAKTIRPALDQIGRRMIARLAEARASHNPEPLLADARRQLAAAGCSEAVITPALRGLEEGLRRN